MLFPLVSVLFLYYLWIFLNVDLFLFIGIWGILNTQLIYSNYDNEFRTRFYNNVTWALPLLSKCVDVS
jgi:hypothetical protein